MEEKKLKTMNEVSAAEAEKWFFEFGYPPDARMNRPPAWFGEVGARDFLECYKLYCDYAEVGVSDFINYEQQRAELTQIADKIPEKDMQELLTPGEKQVFALLKRGLRDKDIAGELCVSVKTVKTHLQHIYRKLGVTTRTEAIARS